MVTLVTKCQNTTMKEITTLRQNIMTIKLTHTARKNQKDFFFI